MAKKNAKVKKQNNSEAERIATRRRNLQIAFLFVSAILILSMVLSAVINI